MRSWICGILLSLTVPVLAIPGPTIIPVPVVNSSAPSKQIQILNEEEPGAAVEIETNLVSGKYNIVVFFADW